MVKHDRNGVFNIVEADENEGRELADQAGNAKMTVYNGDSMILHGSENPKMIMVTNLLTGNNYIPWSRSMKIALVVKKKLGFIKGKIEMPEEDSPSFEQWKCVDGMVISWILSSISKDIAEAFIYCETTRELWEEIAERYGESNAPLMYQIKRDISNLAQNNDSVVVYYSKLKKMWDEYKAMSEPLCCSCDAKKQFTDKELRDNLIQFLMGLNDSFDGIRGQILLMDPLPSINKAYSMVQRIEKQRSVNLSYSVPHEHSAMFNRFKQGQGQKTIGKPGSSPGQIFPRTKDDYMKMKEERAKMTCEYRQGTGHEVNECFKLHGYPDWYKDLKA